MTLPTVLQPLLQVLHPQVAIKESSNSFPVAESAITSEGRVMPLSYGRLILYIGPISFLGVGCIFAQEPNLCTDASVSRRSLIFRLSLVVPHRATVPYYLVSFIQADSATLPPCKSLTLPASRS